MGGLEKFQKPNIRETGVEGGEKIKFPKKKTEIRAEKGFRV